MTISDEDTECLIKANHAGLRGRDPIAHSIGAALYLTSFGAQVTCIGFMVPAVMDAFITVWSILYFATRRST